VPEKDGGDLLVELMKDSNPPPLRLPEELRVEEVQVPPRLRLKVDALRQYGAQRLTCHLAFDYEGISVPFDSPGRGLYIPEARRFLLRDRQAEDAAVQRLREVGVQFIPPKYYQKQSHWEMPQSRLPRVARELVPAGWDIEADGKMFRRASGFGAEVVSGIDWFELHGWADYGNTRVDLPTLLKAVDRGDSMVALQDGSYGVLPEEWLKKLGALPGLGHKQEGHIRFNRRQAGLLDALLAAQPEIVFDQTFAGVREELRRFDGIQPAPQPEGFAGQLRHYQLEGLGWMDFLRQFSFGGCLADDMGVGKTAQVLALLETRRLLRASEKLGPSLVVVPRSLVFNWKQEAARFTPQLRVLDHTGLGRQTGLFEEHDLVLTTYGTLRRDAPAFTGIEFDYVVLDEAQAIKNAGTESAKAVRLLRANHRLALSGTPVENHLGELWSLFEFLNPGMLGAASVFKMAGGAARNPDPETRSLLARALRPFILRRTKQQVAAELPAKTEQTLVCELAAPQRKLYDELRDHYRASLLQRIDADGLAKSKMHVLEALLRLRQAACHPGLIDKQLVSEPSAKLDLLRLQLGEVIEENHKVLVFSQFTSLLAILRSRLDADGITYQYLDGKTRDRQACVERFQNDPECRLFLISLKAGGLGLNLTAAEYVFLLDPWWNPAVEAQAIDRAHRIGQSRQVFAYRLIAKDTVEEKVLELQNSKRDLADAIINADNSLIGGLQREDLELLLS
jgi:superfamily II DNA or RNA helicase